MEKKTVSVRARLNQETHHQLKLQAVSERKSIQEILHTLIVQWLKERGIEVE